jgi:hypothetical protein
MKASILTEKYGEIVYEENIWTGKKKITVNGILLTKLNKKTYEGIVGGERLTMVINGGYITGVVIEINGGLKYRVTEPAKWYDYVLAFIWLPVYLVLSITPAFYTTFPIVGGALGGAIAGIGAALALYTIKPMKNIALKIVISLAYFVGVMLINFALAVVMLSAMI